MTKIIAHRGDTSTYPENTLSAFSAALGKGADAIELDVHLTKDGIPIVHHDYYLGHPDNGEGVLPSVQSSYVKKLKVASSEHIPTLEEVFEAIGDKLDYEIELKGYTEDFIQKVIGLAKKHGLTNRIEFTSPHPYVLTRVKEIDAAFRTGMFVVPYPNWMDTTLGHMLAINNALLGKIDVLHCPVGIIDDNLVTAAHKARLLVHAADCDTEQQLEQAFDAGVDQLSTNNLELALTMRSKR